MDDTNVLYSLKRIEKMLMEYANGPHGFEISDEEYSTLVRDWKQIAEAFKYYQTLDFVHTAMFYPEEQLTRH